MLRSTALWAALALASVPAISNAGETPWEEVLPGVQVRLIADAVPPGARSAVAALEISMPDEYRTYWKNPGQAGIAPQIDLGASQGVVAADFAFPLPAVQLVAGYTDYGYRGHTVLPIELAVDGPARLDISVFMGICSDICMPTNASFQLDLGADEPSDDAKAAIAKGLSAVPEDWVFSDPAIASVEYQAEGNGIVVNLAYEGIDKRSIVAAISDDPGVLFGQSEAVANPGQVFIPLLAPSSGADVAGRELHFVFDSDMGPFESAVTVANFRM